MWTTEVSRKTIATKEQIWKLWDTEVENSKLLGEFQTGNEGVLKSVGGPKATFKIIECTKFKSFTNRSNLPLCKMDFIHTMTETKDGIEITHKIVMTGLMTFLFSKIIGKKIKAGLPNAVDKLIQLAEQV